MPGLDGEHGRVVYNFADLSETAPPSRPMLTPPVAGVRCHLFAFPSASDPVPDIYSFAIE